MDQAPVRIHARSREVARSRPAPPRGGRSARGRASRTRSRARLVAEVDDDGSPPCSPQMPSLSDSFVAGPSRRPSRPAGRRPSGRGSGTDRRRGSPGRGSRAGSARVVARVAERELRQVVGAEAEEVGDLGDLVGGDRRTRDLDHRADLDSRAPVKSRAWRVSRIVSSHSSRSIASSFLTPTSGIMISGIALDLALACTRSRLGDRPDLHLEDLGIGHRQAAAAVPEHRVHLVQLARRGP
jgi:hypothetical protein